MTTINLHIERLVLDGLPLAAHEGPLVGAAVQAELARLIGEDSPAERYTRDSATPLVHTDAIPGHYASGDGLGVQIGRAIHGGIDR